MSAFCRRGPARRRIRAPATLALLAPLLIWGAPAAADPLEDRSGTEDWQPAPGARRPLARYGRAQRLLDEEIEEALQDRRAFDREAAAFLRDRAQMLRALRARKAFAPPPAAPADRTRGPSVRERARDATAAAGADRRAPEPAAPDLDEQLRRLEERAARILAGQSSDATGSAPARQGTAPRVEPDARAADEDGGEDEDEDEEGEEEEAAAAAAERLEQERREAEKKALLRSARAREKREEEEAAGRLGGRLDSRGQFVDPDLPGPAER